MNIAVFLKNNLKNFPPSIGKIINLIPYGFRPGIGSIYRKRQKEISTFNSFSHFQKQTFIFERMKSIVSYAYENIKFYKEYYDKHDFNPQYLISFKDLQLIPIINKNILKNYKLENRSNPQKHSYLVNTGGSGTPLSFFIQPDSMGHEWAHMHYIWNKFDYKPSDFKLVFGGRSHLKSVVEYDVVRNHFSIDIYADYKLVAIELKKVLKNYKIKYLHGYASSIYDFALFCKQDDIVLLNLLSKNLKGVFFGSEYPHNHYRQTIEEVFNVKTISWYGHTERAVLAYEKDKKFKYEPFNTYGFTEAISIDNDNFNLISTSYYNFSSPLIRYNTEDIISDVESDNQIIKSFCIKKGRGGEFVLDKLNKKINLTGLVFGRHHEIFNYSKFIQVKQPKPGIIEIHFVAEDISEDDARSLFNDQNLKFDIFFIKRSAPIRTISGKVNLLIK